jgi:preprotein translocase subunit SecY
VIVLINNFKNVFLVSELRKKVLFTLGVLAVFRFGKYITLPGIDSQLLLEYMNRSAGGLLAHLDLISGGAIRQFSIFALGVGPYISASIMIQILTAAIPTLEQLSKEGEYGRRVINQYTRYLTLCLSIIQGFSLAVYAESLGVVYTPGWIFRLIAVLVISVGALFVMWLGEQITAHGIGNGTSMIIFSGIVGDLPSALFKLYNNMRLGELNPLLSVLLLAITVGITVCIIFLEKGERKIPVQYAKRVIGNRVYGGQSSYIPLKINTSGVIPVIFASAIIGLPTMLLKALSTKFSFLSGLLDIMAPGGILYTILLVILIVFFAYFYTSIIFNPEELADNMRRSGGFVPGIRPGRKTAEFMTYVLDRVSLPGAMYLAALTVVPGLIQGFLHLPTIFSGVSLLIVVGVALDTSAQIESFLIERRYEGFLASGRLKGRAGR